MLIAINRNCMCKKSFSLSVKILANVTCTNMMPFVTLVFYFENVPDCVSSSNTNMITFVNPGILF